MSFVGFEETDTSNQSSDQIPFTTDVNPRLVLRRGSQRMILFTSCPGQSVVRSLRQAGSMIGLAVSSGELTMMGRIDDYDYAFIHLCNHPATGLACALTDLARNNWTRVQDLHESDLDLTGALQTTGSTMSTSLR